MGAVQAAPGDRHSNGPTWDRLESQITWYDTQSTSAQRKYKGLKVVQLLAAAAVPVLAAAGAVAGVTAAAGGVVLVLEGLQQLGQYQLNWITYRSTAEALKHEKYLHLGHAGPYSDTPRADEVLAERVEGLVSQEHATWVSARKEAEAPEKRG